MGILIEGTIQHSKGVEANLSALAPLDGAIAIVETAGNNVELRVGDDQEGGSPVWRDPLAKLKTDVAALQTTLGLVSAKLTTDDQGNDTLQEVLDFIESVQAAITSGNAVVTWSSITSKPATFPPDAHGHTIASITGLQEVLDGKLGAVDGIKAPAF